MSVLDFLFEGQPPQSVTTYGSTVQNVPQWLSDYTQGLITRANAVAGEPYQAYGGPRISGFTPDQNTAFGMTRNNVGAYQPNMNTATNLNNQGAGADPLGAANPYLSQAMRAADAAGSPGMSGLSQAMPYLQGASGMFPQNVDQYMDPYIGHVLNRAQDLTMRTFNEKMMPQLNDQFTAAGQYGSSRHLEEANSGTRDLLESLQGQSLAALSQGYGLAGTQFNADQSRLSGIGSIVGELSGADRSGILGAGQLAGQLGSTAGNLTTSGGNLQLQGGQQAGALAELMQQLGLRDAASLEAVGAQQRGLQQQNLDTAYNDFRQQTAYPRSTIDWMSSVIRGLPQQSQTGSTSSTGPAEVYQPSPLAQLASLYTGFAGLRQAQQQPGG